MNKKEIENGMWVCLLYIWLFGVYLKVDYYYYSLLNVFWYVDYCDIVYIYFGGFFYEFFEGDVIIIFF